MYTETSSLPSRLIFIIGLLSICTYLFACSEASRSHLAGDEPTHAAPHFQPSVFQSSKSSSNTSICGSYFTLADTITAQLGEDPPIELKRLAAGGTGAVYLNEKTNKVYKIPFTSIYTEQTTDVRLQKYLNNARHLFNEEKKLFIDFASQDQTEGFLQSIRSMLVPSRLVELKIRGKSIESIEKDYVFGSTLSDIASLKEESLAISLKSLYSTLKDAFAANHRVLDIRDDNVIFTPELRDRPLTIIDGGYDSLADIEGLSLIFEFENFCQRQRWCMPFYSEDPDFQP